MRCFGTEPVSYKKVKQLQKASFRATRAHCTPAWAAASRWQPSNIPNILLFPFLVQNVLLEPLAALKYPEHLLSFHDLVPYQPKSCKRLYFRTMSAHACLVSCESSKPMSEIMVRVRTSFLKPPVSYLGLGLPFHHLVSIVWYLSCIIHHLLSIIYPLWFMIHHLLSLFVLHCLLSFLKIGYCSFLVVYRWRWRTCRTRWWCVSCRNMFNLPKESLTNQEGAHVSTISSFNHDW